MTRAARLLIGVILLISGALSVLYGLFAIFYRGDSGGSGDTYVELAGRAIDADVVGAVALLFGLLLVLFSRFVQRS
jgi:hypothetical protein